MSEEKKTLCNLKVTRVGAYTGFKILSGPVGQHWAHHQAPVLDYEKGSGSHAPSYLAVPGREYREEKNVLLEKRLH